MSEDFRAGDDSTGSSRGDGSTASHGFDLSADLAARERENLRRRLSPANRVAEYAQFAPPSGSALPVVDGEERLVLAANNYLGLTQDERVQDAAVAATEVVGTGAGASRLVTGDTLVHRDLEERIAETKATDRALAFSSGYAANIGTITALAPDVVFSDAYNHASIVDACRLSGADTVVYDHCDVADLAARMESRSGTVDDESWLVVTDSVFSMDGDVAPLADICDVAEQYGAWMMVDEAHATGLYEDGGGIVQREGLSDRVGIQMGTLSKALASQGGYVAGSDDLIEYLINHARSFVFSTGLAPPSAAAAAEALHVARTGDCRGRLWRNVEYLREELADMGYHVPGETQIIPVRVDDREAALALSDELYERGVVAPAIRPPTVPDGTSRIRVAPMATHSASDLAACLDAFRDAGREVDLL
ncbi:aminotransferase class I/II-fold pyridoxal phosphate-dependent enzyme [Natranaeroarchaeum aerophilus]|uniref:8-amino-7-oxononanoate synthase n=1 Tax=Natranaeroarchaeum aerophilus TaxID=2917711 RepID=A0AAE3K675_9EURY|nr:8-amino-7-oxononanoate synthase [Natranaeroarchaeum aerophilus]MCL9814631.1 8-amino-7-oxononanoate synthase [Natranaeroarchaeum aerophilus]